MGLTQLPDLAIPLSRKVETKSEVPLRAFGRQYFSYVAREGAEPGRIHTGLVGTRKGINLTPLSSFICC